MIRVVRATAVAQPNVEIAIAAKRQVATVVLAVGLHDERVAARPHEIKTAFRVCNERIVVRSEESRDDGVTGRVNKI